MKNEIKVGDLVRVTGCAFSRVRRTGTIRHHIKDGAVCEVLTVGDHSVDVVGPTRKDCRPGYEGLNSLVGEPVGQRVTYSHVKLAKQAMRNRDKYANRRG